MGQPPCRSPDGKHARPASSRCRPTWLARCGLRLPIFCKQQGLLSIGQSSASPSLAASCGGECRLPDSAALGQVDTGLRQAELLHRFLAEQVLDDLLSGPADARSRAGWRSARPCFSQRCSWVRCPFNSIAFMPLTTEERWQEQEPPLAEALVRYWTVQFEVRCPDFGFQP
jgi:hypothetical protein